MNDAEKLRAMALAKYLPSRILPEYQKKIEKNHLPMNEIRLRVDKPVVLMHKEGYLIIGENNSLSQAELTEVFEKLCDYSVYSHQSELSQGFITLPGGHRVGICGTAALDKNGTRTVKFVSSVNIRIANEYIGCSSEIMKSLFSDRITGALIAGPPCCGKTTVLRDIALSLSSEGYMKKVVLVDERGELASVYRGVPQNTVGLFCDVLDGYPKGEGILNAVRTLAPDVIICDEIGSETEAVAISEGVNAGVSIISTIHACNADELYRKAAFKKLLNTGAFEKVAFLKGGEHRCELDRVEEVR